MGNYVSCYWRCVSNFLMVCRGCKIAGIPKSLRFIWERVGNLLKQIQQFARLRLVKFFRNRLPHLFQIQIANELLDDFS